ncbi:zf-HC2 domain-containing protein [Aneurinibacillus thermoaerophilus]|uniref:anti-sigma factor family protein n=1 Tax=Aneurinibacillus thermoaerophilus TaxID=143495 RepID=UPI002E238F02|nr:zf-HC2 domain-containing protein [Aneurinibacillus thermoaerophilus]MED0765743.1 zf-HC2 domain-containing protein [Aneurinibacillus thermoaerophilus]
MKCPDIGFIQAYIDGEINRDMRKAFSAHLEHCPNCRTSLEQAKKLEQWAETAIQEAFTEPKLSHLSIDTDAAWERFEQRLQHELKPVKTKRKGWINMKKPYKKLMAGTAAAAVLLGSLAIPQVQVAASQFLSIFRMDKVEMIKLTQSDLQEIERWVAGNEKGMKEIKGIGKIWVGEQNGDRGTRTFEKREDAIKAGYALPAIPEGYKTENIFVSPSFTLHMQLDTKKTNALLHQLKANVEFDETLDNKPFSLTVPEAVHIELVPANADTKKAHPSAHISYMESGAPQIQVPKDVDLNQLRETVLSLPFIPQNVKQQLASIQDWQRTLPIPYIIDEKHQTREVTVQGAKGIIYEAENQTFLIWQKDGKLHYMNAYDSKNETHTDALLSLANQMK